MSHHRFPTCNPPPHKPTGIFTHGTMFWTKTFPKKKKGCIVRQHHASPASFPFGLRTTSNERKNQKQCSLAKELNSSPQRDKLVY